MKICVLVKQVPSSDALIKLNSDSTWIEEDTVVFVINESDSFALEEALQIKEQTGEGEVVVVSLGPDRVQRAIREALAKGADRGIRIKESFPYSSDPFEIASLFAAAIKDDNFDLILSGLQSDDLGSGQTGVILGELLGMSTATLVMETELLGESIRVKRELESGWFQWVTMTLPASITIQSGINSPRYASLKGIMSAKKKEICLIEKNDLSGYIPSLQSIEHVYFPQKTKRTEMIKGSVDQVVEKLTEILKVL